MNTPADRPANHNLPGHTVLLIDDDPTNLGVISDCLVRAGLEVLIARDGESGLQKARYARPHIILLDVIMPGIDGFETCRRLKADATTKDIPVLFMTALTGTRDTSRAYEAGAVDYVVKPIQVEELLARVRAHLTLHSMAQQMQEQDAQVRQAIAQRERANATLQITEARLRTIIDQLPFDLWAMDDQLRYILQNATGRKQYGDVIGKRIEDLHLPTKMEAQWLEQDRQVLRGETRHEEYETQSEGEKRHYESMVAPVKVAEAIVGIVGIAIDVTQRKQAEEELQLYREHLEELVASRTAELSAEIEERTRVQGELSQVNRMLSLLSECNQVLVRAADETGLLEKICRVIIELGGYRLAWVGLTENAKTQTVRLAAHMGENTGDVADFIEATGKLEHGPVGSAIRSGQPCIVNDVQPDPGDAFWRAEAIRRGYASLIALPLKVDDQVIGALNIYAAQSNAFHPKEVNVLLELASDLAYGLLSLRTRAERQQAEAALAEQHRLLRTLIDAMPDRIYVKDTDSRFLLANDMVAWVMGTTPEEAIGKRDFDFYPQDLAERYYADEQALLASGQALIDREEPGVDLAGNVHWVSTTKVPFRDEQGKIKGFVGIGRDITVRKEMEHVLRQARDELEARVEERTRELKRANERLAGLYRIAQTITAPLQMEIVLDAIARNTAELLESDTGVILLLDETQEVLTIAGAYGLRAEVVQGTRDRIGTSIAGRVVQTGQPIIANDLPHDARFYNPAAATEGLLACASVPLIAGGKIIGTLDVHSKTDRQAFTQDHIQILSMLASQAAIAIENARLYERLQRAHADLEDRVQQRTAELRAANTQLQQEMIERQRAEHVRAAIYRISEATQAASNLDELFASIHATVGELMPAKNFYIALYEAAADLLYFAYHADEVDTTPPPLKPDGTLTGYVLRTGKPLLAPPEVYADLVKVGQVEPYGAPSLDWLGAPLKTQRGDTIGVMAVQTYTEDVRLTEAHKDILLFVSSQVAMAIERKRAEEALRENEARYRTLFELANDALFLETENDEILDVNSRACELLGYSREELLALKVPDLQAPERRGLPGSVIKSELSRSRSDVFEGVDVRRDGTRVPVEISTSRIGDSGLVLAIVRDITERRRAEAALRESEEKYRRIVDTAHEGVWVVDAGLRTTFVNTRMVEMLGYALDDLIGRPFEAFLFEEDRPDHAAQMEAHEAAQYERRMRCHDGQARWVLISATPILDAAHQFQGSFAMLADITARKRAEEHERDLVRNLRAVVAAVDELIACTDLDTFFRRAVELAREKLNVERSAIFLLDPTRQHMLGTYGTDLQGHTMDEHAAKFPPDSLATLLNSGAQLWMVEEKEYAYREGDRRHTHGRGWVATTAIRFGDEPIGLFSNDAAISHTPLNEVTQETIVIYCSLLGNIIERKRAEDKITQLNRDLEHRTSELAALNKAGRILASTLDSDQLLGLVMEQIKALVDAEAASVLLCVPAGAEDAPPELVFAAATGPAAEKLLGTRMSGATGIAGWVVQARQSVHIADSQNDPRFYQQVDAVTGMTTHSLLAVPLIAKGSLVGVMEVINKRSGRFDAHDLEILEALSNSSAIAIDNARLYATEQQRAAALARALEQQRELERLQREFIQNVSHELRTPIGIILGYAELLDSDKLGELHPDQREPIRIIVRRAHMLRRLVEDITAILEIEAHTRGGQRVSLDLAALVQAAIDEFQITAEKAHLTLTAKIEPEALPIYGDAVALRRVLDNLVSNAFKFTPAGGRVTVRLRPGAEKVILEVSDTGIGIAADKLEHIFDRFYQVDGSITRHYGGMGLGLALVKEIVEAHGGQIEVASQVNVGTTFTITLPVGEQ